MLGTMGVRPLLTPRTVRLLVAALAACGDPGVDPDAAHGTLDASSSDVDVPAADAPSLEPARRFTAEVVATYPHDPDAFTQGLEIRDGRLFESTGLRGRSSVRRVELTTGEVLQRRDVASEHFAEGLTVLGGRIYQLSWQSQVAFVYDAESFVVLGERSYDGEGWGLTQHGGALVMSDGTNVVRIVEPDTFAVTRRVSVEDGGVPVTRLNELEMVEGELFANVWMTDRIARIDLESGRVAGWIELGFLVEQVGLTDRDAVLNGIAYDGASRRLFVTGKLWPSIFEIELIPAP